MTIHMTPRSRINAIIDTVCAQHGVTRRELLGRSRWVKYHDARYTAIEAVLREFPDMPYLRLAQIFKRDHTSIISGLRNRGTWVARSRWRATPEVLVQQNEGATA
ncbi:MAG: hypothetical protein EBR82_74605 [Caulobacteraceae bacterium]|nr:hypothetical protein [Caulobacteraceae bacterium]